MKETLLFLFLVFLSCDGKLSDKEYAQMPELFHMDNYDRCMLRGDESFFCSFDYQLEPLDFNNVSDTWKIIQDAISNRMNYRHDILRHYICIRDQCPHIPIMDEDDPKLWKLIENCYNEKFVHQGLKGRITRMLCDTQNTNRYPIGVFEIVVAIILILYISYVIFATFLEGVHRYKSEEEYNKFLHSPLGKAVAPFSLTINWIRLKTVKESPDIERLRCIQGVRTYNLLLVILSHTALTNLAVPVTNTKWPESISDMVINLFLSSGPLCVSTFFLMAGFLLAYGLFEYSEGKKELKPKELVLIFINRCIRLTPTLLFVLLIHATWLPHISNGPLWDQSIGHEYRICRKNGWTNLLYLQTYINKEEMCMMQTWYLGVDTQYFILGLILMYFMKKYESKIPLILGSCLGIHIIVTFAVNYINEYEATLFPEPEVFYVLKFPHLSQWHSQLTASYGNIPGLVIGMAYGYIYYKYKNVNLFTKKIYVVLWWIICLLLPLGIIIFPGLIIYNINTEKNIFWASVYVSLCRTVFTTGIGLLIFGVSQGIGWIVKMCLEWKPTYILGRIVYSSFLIHVALIKIRPALKRYPNYIDEFILFNDWLADIFMAFLAGLLLTLFVEMPLSELQKVFVPQKVTKEKTQQPEIDNNNKKLK